MYQTNRKIKVSYWMLNLVNQKRFYRPSHLKPSFHPQGNQDSEIISELTLSHWTSYNKIKIKSKLPKFPNLPPCCLPFRKVNRKTYLQDNETRGLLQRHNLIYNIDPTRVCKMMYWRRKKFLWSFAFFLVYPHNILSQRWANDKANFLSFIENDL